MTGEIISIGDELLIGQVVNTNASWLAQQLHAIGIEIRHIITVSDDAGEIRHALDEAFIRSDLIVMTGGLGPTRDDITKHTLCAYFRSRLVVHDPTLERIRKFFSARGQEMNENIRKQAEVPSNCEPIANIVGTAPGMWFEKDGRILISMPGVPVEMEAMMENNILPRLSMKDKQQVMVHKTIQTHGEGESILMEMIREWEDALPLNFRLAYLPQPGIVRLRLTAYAETSEIANNQIESQINALQKLIPDLIFGFGNDTMEEVVGNLLRKEKATICIAESCTGGYLSHLITSVAGSSDYYAGSVIAYANHIKHDLLRVSGISLEKYGAVSEQVVRQMAEGARERFGCDYALATSGIAGPEGGTPEKPVGLVWIGLAMPGKTIAKKALFGEHRGRNIRRASLEALNMLRLVLLKK